MNSLLEALIAAKLSGSGGGGGGGGSDNAVLYTQQTLTDAQQEQARANIGAVSLDEIGTVFTLKGGVASVEDLPASGNSVGDVYYVEAVSAGYIWLTSASQPNGYWEELGETFDVTVDSELSATSENPVQNKVINAALAAKGTYSKPSGGIPKSDLASAVQTSLGKADTALQSHQSLAAYRTATAQDTIDAAQDQAIAAKYTKPASGIPASDLASAVQTSLGKADTALQSVPSGYATETWVTSKGYQTAAQVQTAISSVRQLPAVSASDNGKFLRVVSGAWAAATVPPAESNSFGGGS